jgi:hypothetical protein
VVTMYYRRVHEGGLPTQRPIAQVSRIGSAAGKGADGRARHPEPTRRSPARAGVLRWAAGFEI